MPPPRGFRLVYREFKRVEFDPAKSAEVFAERGLDLGYVSRAFPGHVLEQEDTQGGYGERRFRVIAELFGEVFVIIYTLRGETCRVITAWIADAATMEIWVER